MKVLHPKHRLPARVGKVSPKPVVSRGHLIPRAELRSVDVAKADAGGSTSGEDPSVEPQAHAATSGHKVEPRQNFGSNGYVKAAKAPLRPADFPCQLGEDVRGKVLFANEKGAIIDIVDFPGVRGFMPRGRAPYCIRDPGSFNPYVHYAHDPSVPCVSKGLERLFRIVAIPDDMQVDGKGPLVAANNVDLSILWGRLTQICEVCQTQRESIAVRVHGASTAGLLCSLSGLRGFIPLSHIPKENEDTWWTKETLEEHFTDRTVNVSLMTVNVAKNTFTASITNAAHDKVLRKLRVGSLVWGTVRLVREYGAFIAIDDTMESALLHISNLSWERVEDIDQHLHVGERVRCVITGMEDHFTRISLSTKDIEMQPGDFLLDKESVFKNAEEGVKPFLKHVQEWEEEQKQLLEQEWQGAAPNPMEHEDDFRK